MQKCVYIKANSYYETTNHQVILSDFLEIHSMDCLLEKNIGDIPYYIFSKGKPSQIVISILDVIALVESRFPDIEIETFGEDDIILLYQPRQKGQKIKSSLSTFFICLIAFFGGGYAIMAYNTDIGARELFSNLSMLFLGNAKTGTLILSSTYAIGLFIGMILFFNHLGNKKLDTDPTPLEIQMRLYEQDINTTKLKNENHTL